MSSAPSRPPAAARSTVGAAALLAAGGVVIDDGFLSQAEIEGLRESAGARQARGEFRAARIGPPLKLERRSEVRGDSICWLESPLTDVEQSLIERLEQLRLELNQDALLGLFELELHYACYPPGACYARHLDQPRGRSERRVSVILYLNSDWSAADGGVLRIHAPHGPHAPHGLRDIEPLGGRLVLFSSPDCEHEVLPTGPERLSLAGWFRTRADGGCG